MSLTFKFSIACELCSWPIGLQVQKSRSCWFKTSKNSTEKYRDLDGTGTVKIWYRGIPWYREYRPSLISSIILMKQHTVQKTEPKTETTINLVKQKPNRKPQFSPKPNRKPNRSHFLLTAHPYSRPSPKWTSRLISLSKHLTTTAFATSRPGP